MNKKKSIGTLMLLLLLALPCGQAIIPNVDDWMSRDTGPPRTNWYTVEDWEVNYCVRKGGQEVPLEGNAGRFDNNAVSLYGNSITVALQAQRTNITPQTDDAALSETYMKTVYEFAWFLMPTAEEDVSYIMKIYGEEAETLETGTCNYANPCRGYYAIESEMPYTKASITYWNEDVDKETLEVDVV